MLPSDLLVRAAVPPAGDPKNAKILGPTLWTAPGILEALIPGRMQSHACTAEVPLRGRAPPGPRPARPLNRDGSDREAGSTRD